MLLLAAPFPCVWPAGKPIWRAGDRFYFFFFLKLYNTSHHFVDEIHRGSFASPTLHLFLFFYKKKRLPTAERAVEDRKKNNNYRPQLGEEKKYLKKEMREKPMEKNKKIPSTTWGEVKDDAVCRWRQCCRHLSNGT